MGKIILPDSVEARLATRAVSSASVSPESRYQEDVKQFQTYKQDYYAKEAFDKARALRVVDNGRDIGDEMAKMGKRLSSKDVEKRLKSLNSNIVVIPSPHDDKILGIYVMGNYGFLGNGDICNKKFVCRMDRGWLNEGDYHAYKMVKRLVQTNPPVYEDIPELDVSSIKRGWRSICAMLLRQGIINEAGVVRAFGLPSWDSKAWQGATS